MNSKTTGVMDKQDVRTGCDRQTPSRYQRRLSFVLDKAVYCLGDLFGLVLTACSAIGLFILESARFVGWSTIWFWLIVITASIWGLLSIAAI